MRRLIHAVIVAYLHRCHGAFHHGPYGHGVYVRLLSEDGFATCQKAILEKQRAEEVERG